MLCSDPRPPSHGRQSRTTIPSIALQTMLSTTSSILRGGLPRNHSKPGPLPVILHYPWGLGRTSLHAKVPLPPASPVLRNLPPPPVCPVTRRARLGQGQCLLASPQVRPHCTAKTYLPSSRSWISGEPRQAHVALEDTDKGVRQG
jgi:hypothetical protein